MIDVEFFGAAGEVTGSCHIVSVGPRKVLLDCGMIQGGRKQEKRNFDDFPFSVSDIDAVILSHAHLDHSGRLPLLVRRGYTGPIYVQNASRDLAEILLRDAASLAERDVESRNRRRQRAGKKPLRPLYTEADSRNVQKLMRGLRYHEITEVCPGVTLTFHDAGHILGSAIVDLTLKDQETSRRLVFSGDLGQYDTPVLNDPESLSDADLVIMESTYGGRRHRDRQSTVDELGEILTSTKGGNIIIPAFAVGRSQELLYMFGKHYQQWKMERFRVYLDSPLAIKASRIYWDYPQLYDDEATKLRQKLNEMPVLPNIRFTASADESRAINRKRSGAIIIAGSGMCNGGRVLHHLKHNLWRRETQVIMVGYQAKGSTGRALIDGKRSVRIHGQPIRNAATVHTIGGLSAHGDEEDLSRWYQAFNNRPDVCLVHGEPRAGKALAESLARQGAKVVQPEPGQKVRLA